MTEIYYVEDDVSIAQSVKEYLKQKNMSVTVFQTISGAQQILKDHTPDLLLVDWNMPDGQGDVFCQWIRSRWEFLPLIFLTVRGYMLVTGALCGLLAIFGFVALAYYIGGKKVMKCSLAEALRDDMAD